MVDRTPRDLEARERQARPTSWRPPSILPDPKPEPVGYRGGLGHSLNLDMGRQQLRWRGVSADCLSITAAQCIQRKHRYQDITHRQNSPING